MKRSKLVNLGDTFVGGLPWYIWTFKVYAFLPLEELIALKRVCKSFASCKKLSKLITLHEEKAFGSSSRIFWNSVTKCDSIAYAEFCVNYYKCAVYHTMKYAGHLLGVYSSKLSLFKELQKRMRKVKPVEGEVRGGLAKFTGGVRVIFDDDAKMLDVYASFSGCTHYKGLTKKFLASVMHKYPKVFSKMYVKTVRREYYSLVEYLELEKKTK